MKRYMTLVAGVIATVIDIVFVILGIIGIINSIKSVGSSGMMAMIISYIGIAMAASALLSNIIAGLAFKADHEKYRRKYRRIIQAIVLNFLLSGFMIYTMIEGFSVLNLFVLIISIAASALYIVDMCLEKKHNVKPVQEEKQQD